MPLEPDDLTALGTAIGDAVAAAQAAAIAAAIPAAAAAGGAAAGGAAAGGAAAAAGGAGGTGNRKVPSFAEADDPVEWMTWRSKFEMLGDIKEWDDERKRKERFAAMSGAAARAGSDIKVLDPAHGTAGPPAGVVGLTYNDEITRKEERLVKAAASEMSR